MSKTVLFLSSTHKGDVMVREAKALGYRVLLMTDETQRHEPWAYDAIDEFFVTPDFTRYQDVINTVTYLARGRKIDLILPLDEFEVELVAILREHLRITGMGVSLTRHFRDKLTMRQLAQGAGIPVPPFTRILNYDELREYMGAHNPPWMFKPRMEAGSMGIQKLHDSEQVWRALDGLGDKQSYYLLEQFLPGRVYHVDSVLYKGKVLFKSVQEYGKPPFETYQGGGVFDTRMMPRDDPDAQTMVALNEKVIKALGLQNGVTHAEFIKADADGKFYFLEVAARVGGAYISDMIELATGVNLWREWMRIEHALLTGTAYKVPKAKNHYGAVLLTLAKQEHPDLSGYKDKEIAYRIPKPYHAGVIIVAPKQARVVELVEQYKGRFIHDFMTVATPMGVQRTGLTG